MLTSGEREGGGARWGKGLRGANYYVLNKYAARIYCTAQEI